MKYIILLSLFFNFNLQAQTKEKTPFVIGTIDTLYSTILSENRVLNIYLPEGYSPDSAMTYPVIYLLDGSADEDFIHIAGLVQFNNFPWINRFPLSIVVGIANVNRKRDFSFPVPNLDFIEKYGLGKQINMPEYGKSEKFISFIEKELQPFMDKNYKTLPASKTIIGQSLGGLLATEIFLKKPNLFDTYIIISPSLWWGEKLLLEQAPALLKANIHTKKKVYIGVGKEGKIMVSGAKKLNKLLKKDQNEVFFDYLPDEDHGTIGHQAVSNAFKLLYPLKK